MNEQKIEPCPWCGGTATVAGYSREHSVMCANEGCAAVGPERKDDESAISAWNKVAGLRAEVARLKAEIEEIEPGAADKRRWRA